MKNDVIELIKSTESQNKSSNKNNLFNTTKFINDQNSIAENSNTITNSNLKSSIFNEKSKTEQLIFDEKDIIKNSDIIQMKSYNSNLN